jgi:hypothetical protein
MEMKSHRRTQYFLLLAVMLSGLLRLSPSAAPPVINLRPEECTIGVASGSATADGRPLLWKTRDNPDYPDNEVYYNTAYPCRFIAVVNANGGPASEAWMGVNECGFAILNADTEDSMGKDDPQVNGEFMRDALGTCRAVGEFVALLDSTNGNRDTHANFGVIDSTGAGFIFEASPDTYWTYDASAAPGGFIVRANFACCDTAGVVFEDIPGAHRFLRSTDLVTALVEDSNLTCEGLMNTQMRDFSTRAGATIPVPCFSCGSPDSLYGFINSFWSICRNSSVSAAVIHGVAPGAASREPAYLTTLWVLLGHPATAIAVPYWPVGPAPAEADGVPTAPLCDRALAIRPEIFPIETKPHHVDSFRLLDGNGGGLWSEMLPVENWILAEAKTQLNQWRSEPPTWESMIRFEILLAEHALDVLQSLAPASEDFTSPPQPAFRLRQNHPNPFNPTTIISYELTAPAIISLRIYDVAGHLVRSLMSEELSAAGLHEIRWEGKDGRGRDVATGVYFCRLAASGSSQTTKMVLIR